MVKIHTDKRVSRHHECELCCCTDFRNTTWANDLGNEKVLNKETVIGSPICRKGMDESSCSKMPTWGFVRAYLMV
jgi:hypothetical protein